MTDATTSTNRAAAPADTYTGPTVAEMGECWERSLRARNARPETQRTYLAAVTQFDAFLGERGMPAEVAKITREHVEAFIEHLLTTRSASTAKTRFGGLKTFFRYVCEDEGEVERSPMERMRAPTVEDAETPIPDPDALRRLLKSCSGKSFDDRRDRALFMLAGDTGLRRGELAALTLEDVDVKYSELTVRAASSKRRRSRTVPFGPDTGNALDRYLRERRRHPKAARSGD
ncbi:MAG: tyrosine-type recombinase/integrase, partial [Acidimicrobiales bacterium]